MKIAIIGAGNVGSALAHALSDAGHRVAISSSSAEDARKVAEETGALAASGNREAVADAEAVVLAVPYDAVESIVKELNEALEGRILIDVTNRFSADELDGPSNAENIQAMAPQAHVVKAFNTVFAGNQAAPRVEGMPLDGFVAADEATSKQKTLDLLESLGYRPIDAGPLAMARALEGMGMLNIALNMNNGWSWRSGWKLVGPLG